MIQKKICMLGVFGTGKTSLVRQFVSACFSERYQSTVGVKIERKRLEVEGAEVSLLLWDLSGLKRFQAVQGSYLRGASGIIYVVDGTRRDTLEQLGDLQALVYQTVGAIPAVYAFNKVDLLDAWRMSSSEVRPGPGGEYCMALETSAKTGHGVDEAFTWLATAMLRA